MGADAEAHERPEGAALENPVVRAERAAADGDAGAREEGGEPVPVDALGQHRAHRRRRTDQLQTRQRGEAVVKSRAQAGFVRGQWLAAGAADVAEPVQCSAEADDLRPCLQTRFEPRVGVGQQGEVVGRDGTDLAAAHQDGIE